MALTATDFIEPTGELSEEMFPGKDVEEFAGAWLAEAASKAGGESAQRAWVYYRAYSHVANRMHADPANAREGSVSVQVTDAQIQHWQRLAMRHAHEFYALTGQAAGAFLQPTGYAP